MASTPESLGSARARRIADAMQLKQPDRVPLIMSIGYMLAELGGITNQQLLEDPARRQRLLEQAALEYEPDSIHGPFPADPTPYLLLGDRMTAWPGHGRSPNIQYQFVENEFMKEEDYDRFLEDPTDWVIRTYLPRAFTSLEAFSSLPPLNLFVFGSYFLNNVAGFASGPIAESFKAFAGAAQAIAEYFEQAKKDHDRMVALGFPDSFIAGPTIAAPFDALSDALRGMRGIMVDIIRRPEKIIAAEDKLVHYELEFAINTCKLTGATRAFLPLHRGSDGFMSLKQFEDLYWRQLKYVLETLVEHGITPIVFYEGRWDQRLEYLAELPKGKTVGWFQATDLVRAKEVLGDTMCIVGGMPNSLLKAGPAEEVRAHTKRMCEVVGKGGGFMMCSGVGELAGSDPGLVKVWAEATKEFGTY